jgi:hypothetical protein
MSAVFQAPRVNLFQPGLVWYAQADRNAQPCPAIPVEQSGNGVVTMLVMRKHNSTILTKTGVQQVEELLTNPKRKKELAGAN